MNLQKMLDKINNIKIKDFTPGLGLSFKRKEIFDSYTFDQSKTILQLRNKVHHMSIELMDLKAELKDNKRLQEQNEGVKKAWEQYQIMLTLAKLK